jgi:ADP-ribose pyrophosphatase YjhB (NUDIX family)
MPALYCRLQANREIMLAFDTDKGRFTYRAAGVALHDSHILLQRAEHTAQWFLPGGRGEMLETSYATLQREMYEELGVSIQVRRLLWIAENFFVKRGKPWHEISFCFLMNLPSDFIERTKHTAVLCQEQNMTFEFRWLPVDTLPSLQVYPSFLPQKLARLPQQIEHIVQIDDESAALMAER